MEKKITITEDANKQICMSSTGFTCVEILGLLRFQEKALWLQMINASEKNQAKRESIKRESIKMEFNIPAKRPAPKKKSVAKKKKK